MSTIKLCNPTTSLQIQSQTDFHPKLRNIKPQLNLNSLKLSSHRLKSLSQVHTNVITCIDKILEPSVSSSSSRIQESPLKIGIVGLGAFGQFLANAFQRQGHKVLGTSRSDYSEYCEEHDIQFFPDVDGLCETQPDVLLICSSIVSTEKVVKGIPFHKLNSNTIIADVLSVKQFAKNLLLENVPEDFGILCTHPMFGKYSGKNSWEGLRFVYERVRVSEEQARKCEQFLDIFQDEGCKMVEMTCEEHDQYAAESQFVTHTVARILSNMDLQATPIDTKGYETLRELTNSTVSHGSDLYDGLFLYNMNSAKQIQKLEKALDTVKHNLFAKLRQSFQRQMEESDSAEQTMEAPSVQFLPSSEKELSDVSSYSSMVSERDASQKQFA